MGARLPGFPHRDGCAGIDQPGRSSRSVIVPGAPADTGDPVAQLGAEPDQADPVPDQSAELVDLRRGDPRLGAAGPRAAAAPRWRRRPCLQPRRGDRLAPQRVHQVHIEAVILQELDEPAPAERGLERHRRPRGQTADQPQHRLGTVHHVLVELDRAVLGDHRHLGALAVPVDAGVDRHCRVSSPELVLSPGASRYRAELGRGPALIGSCE